MKYKCFGLFSIALVYICWLLVGVRGITDGSDVTALKALSIEWSDTIPPTWTGSDPCGSQWDGVACSNSRVTAIILSSMGLKGSLPRAISSLSALGTLDLSYNPQLTGMLPSTLGDMVSLQILNVIGCGFSGAIPSELGNLINLNFLALNSNKFSGPIPPSFGKLANVSWLDIADNQLTGPIPVSNATQSGLDQLVNANHFHFNQNNLSGTIPPRLFNGSMQLIHVLFDSNNFEGQIPSTLGLVKSLQVVRLDRNFLTGPVPSNISNLESLSEINLSNNQLNNSIPNLSNLTSLKYMDISNNSFNSSQVPVWLTSLQQLTTVVMENCSLSGEISSNIFDLPVLETVRMRTNRLNGSLIVATTTSSELQLVDLRDNNIDSAEPHDNIAIWLAENPVCNPGNSLSSSKLCLNNFPEGTYETNLAQCGGNKCSGRLKVNPRTCQCQQPYEGQLTFRAPSFSSLTDIQRFQSLEKSLQNNLQVDSVYICCLNFDSRQYLIVSVQLFPNASDFFTRSQILNISFKLSSQEYKPPEEFGPFYFIANQYIIDSSSSSSLSSGIIAGIAVGATVLAIVILVVGCYALRQKKRAKKAMETHNPFGTWRPNRTNNGEVPELKGARWFTFAEIKKATNNFSEINEIGRGGYGKVYKATLDGGTVVAIKRAQQGSLQGGAEFKNEIELLSRVHHKNLVGLIGFCVEDGEQMLIYEYIPNGTLRENLIGNIPLDWGRRVQIALGSARGLSYLHDLANPPIIHRDIKSSNILLDENMNAKVADFGLSKLVADGGADAGGKGHVSTQVKGTLGYLDPEYYMTQQLSDKSDVYSFGIVMLELITARLPIEGGKFIVRLVETALDTGGISALQKEMMDPVLRDFIPLAGFEQFLDLALYCIEEVGSKRPAMREVVKELETIIEMEEQSFTNSSKLQSDPVNLKWSPHFYDENEAGNSAPLVGKAKDGHDQLFNYSGAYMSQTVEPK